MSYTHSLKRTVFCLAAGLLHGASSPTFSMDKTAPVPFTCQAQYTGLGHALKLHWFRTDRSRTIAKRVLNDLVTASKHGLNPTDFQANRLAKRVADLHKRPDNFYPGAFDARVAQLNRDLTRAATCYLQQVHSGQLEPEMVHARTLLRPKYWRAANALKSAWIAGEVVKLFDTAAPRSKQYRLLAKNLARLRAELTDQTTAGWDTVNPLQRIAQVELAMERIRWLPRDGGQRRVEVNIPEFKMRVTARDRLLYTSKVVVGKPGRTATPLFAGRLSHVVLNPSWYVPHSIAKYKLLPKIRNDPGYIRQKNMLFTEKDGTRHHAVTDEILSLVASNKVRIQQLPGSENALGNYKFVLPNHRAIFMHDTNQPELFDREVRAFSSGCVRIEKPDKLARLVLGGSRWNSTRIRDQINEGETRKIRPRRASLVILNYQTARAVSEIKVRFFDDLYGLDAQAVAYVPRWSRAFKPPTILARH